MYPKKNYEMFQNALGASLVIGVLALLTEKTSTGLWIMFSFGSTALIVFVFYKSEFAQPKNVILGHLLSMFIGIVLNNVLGFSFLSIALGIGLAVFLMSYFDIIHPPAAANPLIAIFTDVSFEFLFMPVFVGSILIVVMTIFINQILFKRKYPNKKLSFKF